MLLRLAEERDDRLLFRDLLRYDWLRCGHRFLPECLQLERGEEQPSALKRRLFKHLPEEKEGVYTNQSRNRFFKTSFFLSFSGKTLQTLGYCNDQQPGVLCFLSEREENIFRLNKVVLIKSE